MNTGTNDSVMMSRQKKSAGPTSVAASPMTRHWSAPSGGCAAVLVAPALEVLVRVLDHHDRRVDHRADGDGDAAERHDVRVHALVVHDDERHQDADRQRDDRDERRAQVEQEHEADERDDDEFLDQLLAEVGTPRS